LRTISYYRRLDHPRTRTGSTSVKKAFHYGRRKRVSEMKKKKEVERHVFLEAGGDPTRKSAGDEKWHKNNYCGKGNKPSIR